MRYGYSYNVRQLHLTIVWEDEKNFLAYQFTYEMTIRYQLYYDVTQQPR